MAIDESAPCLEGLAKLLLWCADPKNRPEMEARRKEAEGKPLSYRIYLMAAVNGLYKIGFSYDPSFRLRGVKSGLPCEVQLLTEVDTGLSSSKEARKVEGAVHRRFAISREAWPESNCPNEWFRLDAKQVADFTRVVGEEIAKKAVTNKPKVGSSSNGQR